MDLASYVNNSARKSFSEFSRECLITYGFDREYMFKLLTKNYVELTIVEDQLVKRVA